MPYQYTWTIAAECVSSTKPADAIDSLRLQQYARKVARELGGKPPNLEPVVCERDTLNFFARRFFRVAELKHQQHLLIDRAIHKESMLGILPTGFGKSLIFQLLSIISLRTSLVISPLLSLMRDQLYNLRKSGITCAEAISGENSSDEKDHILGAFSQRQYRMLYISPERFLQRDFLIKIRQSLHDSPVGYFIIDEAHCISEWGHDFRPAYMQIPIILRMINNASQRHVPVLALTATASTPVREDIINVLEIDSVIQLASCDRKNLSISVHPVADFEEKDRTLIQLLESVIPEVLSIDPEIMLAGKDGVFTDAGIIFSTFADTQGRSIYRNGVHYAAEHMRKILGHADSIKVFSSTAAKSCPHCNYSIIVSQGKRGGSDTVFRCSQCNKEFFKSKLKRDPAWKEKTRKAQDDFQKDLFPILVATKGYGMGIDKRNIRYIIHNGLSSGLESYYQEAGRAGRDEKHAHVALLYVMPTPACRKESFDIRKYPKCVENESNYLFYKCPYHSTYLCEFGIQARFIRASILQSHDYQTLKAPAREILSAILQDEKHSWQKSIEGDTQKTLFEYSIYRLQQLGVVDYYFMKYQKIEPVLLDIAAVGKKEISREQIEVAFTRTMVRTKLTEIDINEQLAQIPTETLLPEFIDLLLQKLLERMGSLVSVMRYDMLWNELDFAQDSRCRRIILRSIFDDQVPTDDYRCEFCDVCAPELHFTRDTAVVPLEDKDIDAIVKDFANIFALFNKNDIEQVATLICERRAELGMYARVAYYLEGDTNNLSARYLAGLLASKRKDRQVLALDHYHHGFSEALRQEGNARMNARAFYVAATEVDMEEAFSWIVEKGGEWDTVDPDDLRFLRAEAVRLFDNKSHHTRSLSALQVIRAYNSLEREIKETLSPLQEIGNMLLKQQKLIAIKEQINE